MAVRVNTEYAYVLVKNGALKVNTEYAYVLVRPGSLRVNTEYAYVLIGDYVSEGRRRPQVIT